MKKPFASSPLAERRLRKGAFMKKAKTKPVSKEIEALLAMPEEDIDLSDIPEVSLDAPRVVGRFYRPIKTAITVRLDADVLAWFRAQGSGWQTRMNEVLKAYWKAMAKAA